MRNAPDVVPDSKPHFSFFAAARFGTVVPVFTDDALVGREVAGRERAGSPAVDELREREVEVVVLPAAIAGERLVDDAHTADAELRAQVLGELELVAAGELVDVGAVPELRRRAATSAR